MLRNKKHLIVLISSVLIVLSISSVVYANEAWIEADNLNVRNGPGTDYEQISQVNSNEQYTIIQEQGNWVEIEFQQGTTGWVTKDYISIQEEPDSTEADEGKENIETTIDSLTIVHDQTNIRGGPSTDDDIIGMTNRGTVLDIVNSVEGWYEIKWEKKTGFVPERLVDLTGALTNTASPSVKNKTIVVDAGHGGRDVGAIGASGNYEKDYTLQTAKKIKFHLEILGAEVILTRNHDNYLRLSGRPSVANLADADAFLSIHYNSTPQYPSAKGVSTYHYSDRDKQLATIIQAELLKATTMDDRGIHKESFQVTRESHRPSVLLELGFLSNVSEEENIQSAAFQEKIAQGIISGLSTYFSY
ncbi:N-acetylmuramoyl-L-alanine amidase [Aquibacillus saliphilus]|uniref:N-acetylmuramoyl-L-alanine amidase n=1 Tax=Aquibacillus saliphilus TaxID=1909422 RepID=UPI001CF02C39|nr:N-acetylmuramoyl-L-alanine amidase [Aquibacillus saliphilus]